VPDFSKHEHFTDALAKVFFEQMEVSDETSNADRSLAGTRHTSL